MRLLNTIQGIAPGILILSVLLAAALPVAWVSAGSTSDTYEGYLGDTIDLHGVSYTGDQVYLFFTGPGLPDNGVTLTDPSQRADQGHFTIVGLDSNQQWAFKWDTFRIKHRIDPGPYTVYVVTAPVDKANLAGTSYETLKVDLKNPDSPEYSSPAGASYTLNPEKLTGDSVTTAPPTTTTTPTPATTPPTTIATTSPTLPVSTPTPRSASFPLLAFAGVTCAVMVYLQRKW